jgi:two-component system NtrC family response regulator
LIESELFGHKKGAFTGADENRSGLFEVADGGTLFLDEIGELPVPIQAKLLRVLETGEVRRVGDNMPFKVDVRIVAATHRDLADMASKGTFRSDLMYRVNTFEIRIPALRERIEDIPSLAVHLLARHRATVNLDNPGITDSALGALKGYAWPGNIRELANVIEHASILCDELPLDLIDLPANLQSGRPAMATVTGQMTLREIEEQAIQASLDRHNGNKSAASEELGISIKTLYNKLNQSSFYRAA